MKKYTKQILAMLALNAIYSGSGILILSFINKYLLDGAERGGRIIALFFALLALFLLLSVLSRIMLCKMENDFVFDLRTKIIKQIIDTNNDGKIDSRDMVVSSWGVDNWTGRSAVLNEEPAKPCADANCTQAPRPGLCPEGTLTSVALTADSRQVLCVSIPGPNRWWWRELAVPDVTYNAGATPTAVPTGTVPSAAKGGSPRP